MPANTIKPPQSLTLPKPVGRTAATTPPGGPTRNTGVYAWKKNFTGRRGLDPDIVANIVEKIEKRWGRCTPEMLLKEAKPEDSPIHDLFDWDDQSAAEKYRLAQARVVISSVRLVIDEHTIPVPAFVHVRTVASNGQVRDGYRSVIKAMSEPESRSAVLMEAITVLQGYRRRYAQLTELAEVLEAIDKVSEKYL